MATASLRVSGNCAGLSCSNSADQRAAFGVLPSSFRFKDAAAVYGRADQATTDFLNNCMAAGILRKLAGRNGYEKNQVALMAAGVSGVSGLDGSNLMIIN